MRPPIDPTFLFLLISSLACGGQGTGAPNDHGGASTGASGSANGNSSGAHGASSAGDTSGNVTSPGVIAVLGTPCSPPAALACAGHAQKVTLICNARAWTYASSCRSGENCDSRPGANQGICLAIDPLCASTSPGSTVCADSTTAVQCGPDLVSDSPAGKCVTQACVAGACTGVCSPGATVCMTDKQLVTCNDSGQWGAAATCPNGCFGGSSAAGGSPVMMGTAAAHCGACVPNARQCMFGGSICGPNGEWPSDYNPGGCFSGNPNGGGGGSAIGGSTGSSSGDSTGSFNDGGTGSNSGRPNDGG